MANWNQFGAFPEPGRLRGGGYSLALVPGWNVLPADALNASQIAFPLAGPPPPNSQALVLLIPVYPQQYGAVYQSYAGLENPAVQMMVAANLGLMQILGIAPLRQMRVNGADALVREFDARSAISGRLLRFSALLLRGPCSAMQIVVGVDLYQWTQWVGPALQFVAQVRLDGIAETSAEVRSIVDPANPKQIEMQLIDEASGQRAPVMTVPTEVNARQVYQVIVQAGAVVHMGEITGTNVQVGTHNAMLTGAGQKIDVKNGGSAVSNFSNSTFNNYGPSQQGDNNTMTVGSADTKQLQQLLEQLQNQLKTAPLPEPVKRQIMDGPVAEMQSASRTQDPKPAIAGGLTSLNQTLKTTAVAGDQLLSIAKTAASIAGVVKLALPAVAPFLGGIL